MNSLKLTFFLTGFRSFLIYLTFFFLPIFLKDLGMTGLQIGSLMGLFSITGLVLVFPAGILNDSLQSRHLISFSFVALTAFYLVFPRLSEYSSLFIAFSILGVCLNLLEVSFNSIVYKLSDEAHGITMGRYNFSKMFGLSFGLLLSGIVLTMVSKKFLFIGSAILSVFMILVSLKLPSTSAKFVGLKSYGSRFFRKEVIYYLTIMSLFAFHWGAEMTSYSLFLKKNLGLNWMQLGIYTSIPIMVLAVSSLKVGKALSQKMDFIQLLIYGLILSGVFHIVMVIPNVYGSFFARILHEAGDGIVLTLNYYVVSQLFGKEEVGGLGALCHLVNISSAFIGAMVFGNMGEAWGYQWPMIVSGVIGLTPVPLVFLLRNKMPTLQESRV
jgi:DHA1 family quinolone resistance protein-like MFS transporter